MKAENILLMANLDVKLENMINSNHVCDFLVTCGESPRLPEEITPFCQLLSLERRD